MKDHKILCDVFEAFCGALYKDTDDYTKKCINKYMVNRCPFSKYKHILGIPKKGVHRYRLLGTAIIDYILTIIFYSLFYAY